MLTAQKFIENSVVLLSVSLDISYGLVCSIQLTKQLINAVFSETIGRLQSLYMKNEKKSNLLCLSSINQL